MLHKKILSYSEPQPAPQKSNRSLHHKLPKVRELFCLLVELKKIVGDLWRELHAVFARNKKADKIILKNPSSVIEIPLRARVYTGFISRKKHSPLHTVRVSRWFSDSLSVNALKSKPSHMAERLWRVGRRKPSQAITIENQNGSGSKRPLRCEGLKIKAFTLKSTENQKEKSSMWRGEYFFRGKKTYREILVSGKSSRPSGCATKGHKAHSPGQSRA